MTSTSIPPSEGQPHLSAPSDSSPDSSPGEPSTRLRGALAILLALLVGALFAPARLFEFVNFDDVDYITGNPLVLGGLSKEGLLYAWTGGHAGNWHPLTTLSHLLDAELFEVTARGAAGGHHLTSIVLHALNAALCFLVLTRLSGRLWSAFLIAALFAVHPLRVESVAWISERKDVLSGTFFFLTLLAWFGYARAKAGGQSAGLRYGLVVLFLALGLMAKQMLVTVPFVLLLLDMGPLGRWIRSPRRTGEGRTLSALAIEKLPLFALSIAACVPMWLAQSGASAVGSIEALSPLARVQVALAGYLHYVGDTLWPSGLASFYPHPLLIGTDPGALWVPALLGALLIVILGALSVRCWKSMPALGVGWFWFLGMLVPVIGLVQIGSQSHADRYTYLPSVGLCLMLGAAVEGLVARRTALRVPCIAVLVIALGALSFRTSQQLATWSDSRTLSEHALAVTTKNFVAHNNLGIYHLNEGADSVRAAEEFGRALDAYPGYARAAENLGIAYEHQGRAKDAIAVFQRVLQAAPDNARVLARLGALRRRMGDDAAAIELLSRATELEPTNADHWIELGKLRLIHGEGIFAEKCAERAIAIDPDLVAAHILYGHAARMLNYPAAAVQRIQKAVELAPENVEASLALARILADQARLEEAQAEIQRVLEFAPETPDAHVIMSKIHLVFGRTDLAKLALEKALEYAPDNAESNELLAVMYRGEGRLAESEERFLRAIELRPGYPAALNNLGALYEQLGREVEALGLFDQLLESGNIDSPLSKFAACRKAWILATSPDPELHDGPEAVSLALFGLRRFQAEDPASATPHISYAVALARVGRWPDALEAQARAIELARSPGERAALERRMELFRRQKPFQRQARQER